MAKINIVYEYDDDHVDLVEIPEEAVTHLEDIVQAFFTWMYRNKDHPFWMDYHGRRVLTTGAESFIWWLNTYRFPQTPTARLLKLGDRYHPEFPMADF